MFMIARLMTLLTLLVSAGTALACTQDTITIRQDSAKARFSIEIADDLQEQAQGLMHREDLARFSGMLFVYNRPRRATFWMRNTLIPLDMLFIDRTGTVVHLHENAEPLSERIIDGGRNIKAVLEINGGMAAKLRIGVGATMQHPVFAEDAAWPCAQ